MSSFDSSLENNSEDVPLLKGVLQQAVDLDLLGRSCAEIVFRRFQEINSDNSSDVNKEKITIDAWNIAVKDTGDLKIATYDRRVNTATLIMDHVVKAYQKRKEGDLSKKVIGSMIKEALEWDANAQVPSSLQNVYQKVSTKYCNNCKISNPDKNCPCGVKYCSRQCQLDSWKEHKKTCSYQTQRRINKGE